MTVKHRLIAGIGIVAIAAAFGLILKPANADREDVKKLSPAEKSKLVGMRAAAISPSEKSAIMRAVKAPRMVSHMMIYQTFNGPISQLDEFLADFYKEFNDQKLGTDISGDKAPYAVVYSHPEKNQSVKIDIGYAVSKRAKVKAPLAIRMFNLGKAVAHVHTGPYGQITAVHNEVLRSLKVTDPDAGFPAVLHLLTDPSKVSSPAAIRTEVIVPTAKVEMQ